MAHKIYRDSCFHSIGNRTKKKRKKKKPHKPTKEQIQHTLHTVGINIRGNYENDATRIEILEQITKGEPDIIVLSDTNHKSNETQIRQKTRHIQSESDHSDSPDDRTSAT